MHSLTGGGDYILTAEQNKINKFPKAPNEMFQVVYHMKGLIKTFFTFAVSCLGWLWKLLKKHHVYKSTF